MKKIFALVIAIALTLALAVPALAARHYLVGSDTLSYLESLHVLANLHDMSEELVSWYKRSTHPRRLVLIAPELSSALITLQVSGADTAPLGLDDDVVWSALRHWEVKLKPIITLCIGDERLHGFRQFHADKVLFHNQFLFRCKFRL